MDSIINDKTIESVTFITAKPIINRLDVFPFLILYSLAIGAYMNAEVESYQIALMIAILLIFVAHVTILLIGYWRVTFRMKIAYNIHQSDQLLSAFSKFDENRYTEGIRYIQDEYEGELTRYKLWYTFYDKKLQAARIQHARMVQAYNNNPENSIPPGPFIPPDAPTVPQLKNPVALYNGCLLEAVIIPHKHHGNPIISRVVYEVADNTRIRYTIQGLLTPAEVLSGSLINNSSQIIYSGPKLYPALQFSYHHSQYTIDPHQANATFQSRQYPDNDKLANYLTHRYTATTPTPEIEIVKSIENLSSGKNKNAPKIPTQPISTAKNSITLQELFRTASSSASSSYRLLQYGFNSLTVPIPGFITLFIENAMSPFFVFQIACILLWCLDEYWYYSLFTLVMVVILECTVVYKRQSHLTQMLGEKPSLPFVHVYRRFETASHTSRGFSSVIEQDPITRQDIGGWILTPTKQLVPGDIVAVPVYNDSSQINHVFGNPNAEGIIADGNTANPATNSSVDFLDRSTRPTLFSTDIPCDMLLLSGSCVCDESMLSGESVPQVKEDVLSLQTSSNKDDESPIFDKKNKGVDDSDELQQQLDEKSHRRYQLYSGTKLIGIQRNYQHAFFSNKTKSGKNSTKSNNKSVDSVDGVDGDNNNNNNDNNNDDIIDTIYDDKKQNFMTLTSRPPLAPGTDIVLCRVLRTGFSTTQGSLVRTILTAADNVLVDKEALYFILGLLCCAIVSAYFVLIEGLADETRSRYKLLLNVITILTSVVPPELPMQLSMAVNTALASLAKTQVFCTEPNRLPSSGQIDICAFDKTGTLTADKFLLACSVTPSTDVDCLKDKDATRGYLTIKLDHGDRIGPDSDDKCVDENNNPGNDNDNDGDSKNESLDLRNLPIDTRIVLGCAQELAMLQLPAKKTPPPTTTTTISPNAKKQATQRIVGDPMEEAGFSCAGFKFFPRQQQTQGNVSENNQDHINNKMFFEANPVSFDQNNQKYIPTPNIEPNLTKKIRFDTEILHRFTFQSQLQRMSSIIAIQPPESRSPYAAYQPDLDKNNDMNWFGTTLPPSLRNLSSQTLLRVVVKGSPEMIFNSLHPDHRPDFHEYTRQHKSLARQGLRILALAWKPLFVDTKTNLVCDLNNVNNDNVKGSIDAYKDWAKKHGNSAKLTSANLQSQFLTSLKIPSRDVCESNLFFAGIIGFNSPLKTQSLEVITHLQESNHKTIMITGDHLLTAIAVAKELSIAKENCYLLTKEYHNITGDVVSPVSPGGSNANDFKLVWKDEFEQYISDYVPGDSLFTDLYDNKKPDISLCINGDSLAAVVEKFPESLTLLCSVTSVFARTLPAQKEAILKYLREYKNGSQTCLMCGDGTNDVGALTHANIGIALSSIDTDSKEQLTAQEERFKEMYKNPIIKRLLENAQKLREKGFVPQAENVEKQAHDMYKRLKQSKLGSMLGEMDMEDDDPGAVKLGDASLAASFSAKHGSIRCVLDVIRQGRCALATTGQMYQILALQCLVAAYSLSALYFQGVRQSESQMTIGGLVQTAMSMMLSNAQPLQKISSRRPNSKIFSPYNITTIGLQFIVHLGLLMYMVNYAMQFTDLDTLKQGQDETVTKYIPSVLNTVVFIMSTAMGATTILANYVGFPFMTPLTFTTLFKVILGTIAFSCALSMEMMPEVNEMLEMTPMPNEDFSFALTTCIILDCILCVVIGLGTKLCFGIATIDDLTQAIPRDVISHAMTSKGPPGLNLVKNSQLGVANSNNQNNNQNNNNNNNNNNDRKNTRKSK
jgi:cation-transporting ATPase 13A1